MSPVDHDLLTLLKAIVFADRRFKRYARHHRARHLSVTLPVFERSIWDRTAVRLALQELLGFATGDHWEFEFRTRKGTLPGMNTQRRIAEDRDDPIILPFSGGMDSYASFKLLKADGRNVIPVSAVTNDRILARLEETLPRHALDPGIRFRAGRVRGKRHESSYRTRPVVFLAYAALIAKLLRASEVVIPENGQGAIGSSLISSGAEYPYQLLHPGFTHRLSRFCRELWEWSPQFSHPHLWLTKAQLIEEVHSVEEDVDWLATVSCSRTGGLLRRKGPDLAAHCGICANCLLRRLALVASGNSHLHREQKFVWKDLNAKSLHEAVATPGKHRGLTTDNDLRVATAAVLAHSHLTTFVTGRGFAAPLARCAAEVSQGMDEPVSDIRDRIEALLKQHQREWASFLEQLSKDSWLVKMARPRE